MRHNPLQLIARKVSAPAYVYPKKFWLRLLTAVNQKLTEGEARPLPERWDVELSWRNPATKHGITSDWQSGEFVSVVNESNDGFAAAVVNMIEIKLTKLEARQNERKKKISQNKKRTKNKKRRARKTKR